VKYVRECVKMAYSFETKLQSVKAFELCIFTPKSAVKRKKYLKFVCV